MKTKAILTLVTTMTVMLFCGFASLPPTMVNAMTQKDLCPAGEQIVRMDLQWQCNREGEGYWGWLWDAAPWPPQEVVEESREWEMNG